MSWHVISWVQFCWCRREKSEVSMKLKTWEILAKFNIVNTLHTVQVKGWLLIWEWWWFAIANWIAATCCGIWLERLGFGMWVPPPLLPLLALIDPDDWLLWDWLGLFKLCDPLWWYFCGLVSFCITWTREPESSYVLFSLCSSSIKALFWFSSTWTRFSRHYNS